MTSINEHSTMQDLEIFLGGLLNGYSGGHQTRVIDFNRTVNLVVDQAMKTAVLQKDPKSAFVPTVVHHHAIGLGVDVDYVSYDVDTVQPCPNCGMPPDTARQYEYSNQSLRNRAFCKSCNRGYRFNAKTALPENLPDALVRLA